MLKEYINRDVPEPERTGFCKDLSDRNGSFGPERIFVPDRTGSEWTGFYFGPDRTGTDFVHDWTGTERTGTDFCIRAGPVGEEAPLRSLGIPRDP